MKTDTHQNSVNSSAEVIWEDRWVRFRAALKADGVEPRFHDFYRSWVLGFVKFIKPKKFSEVGVVDVENFLSKLGYC